MKRLLTISALILCVMPVFAQKNNIVLGKVSGNVDSQWTAKLRSGILQGLTSTGRLDVVDGVSLNGLASNTSEALLQLKEAGAQYYLEANLETLTTSSEYVSSASKTQYKAKLEYSYQLFDLSSGAVLSNKKTSHYGSSYDSSDAAIANSFSLVDNDLVSMVNNLFRVTAEIKAINETHPKKGIISVYLGAGSSDGVAKGNIFEIFKVMDVAGEMITEKIGEMKVVEVKSANLSLCNVTKGGKELQDAMDNELPVQVTSRPPKDILGGINNVLNVL